MNRSDTWSKPAEKEWKEDRKEHGDSRSPYSDSDIWIDPSWNLFAMLFQSQNKNFNLWPWNPRMLFYHQIRVQPLKFVWYLIFQQSQNVTVRYISNYRRLQLIKHTISQLCPSETFRWRFSVQSEHGKIVSC